MNSATKNERTARSIENEVATQDVVARESAASTQKKSKRSVLAMLVADASVSSRDYVIDFRAGKGAE